MCLVTPAPNTGDILKKVGSFCCSVPPVPPVSASVARCGPDRAKLGNLYPVGCWLRGDRECLVVVGIYGF